MHVIRQKFYCIKSITQHLFLAGINILCLQSFKCCNWNISHQGIQFVWWIFIIIPSPGQTNPHTKWYISRNERLLKSATSLSHILQKHILSILLRIFKKNCHFWFTFSNVSHHSQKFQHKTNLHTWYYALGDRLTNKNSNLLHVSTSNDMKYLLITYLIPFDHTCLFSRVSTRTSGVPICFIANLRISLIARGARFLNPTPCSLLCRFMVYSRVTTSLIADLFFFSPLDFAIFCLQNTKEVVNLYTF